MGGGGVVGGEKGAMGSFGGGVWGRGALKRGYGSREALEGCSWEGSYDKCHINFRQIQYPVKINTIPVKTHTISY